MYVSDAFKKFKNVCTRGMDLRNRELMKYHEILAVNLGAGPCY